jgi:hypothetical protein
MKADMDRKTARKYVAAGQLPSEMKQPRDWRTRPDPFAEHWPEVEARLRATPELEAKTLFRAAAAAPPGPLPGRPAAHAAAPRQAVARGPRAGARGRAGAAAPPGRGRADRLHARDRARGDDRRVAVRAPAVRARAAVLELAVGDGLLVGVDGGAAQGRAAGAVPARAGHSHESTVVLRDLVSRRRGSRRHLEFAESRSAHGLIEPASHSSPEAFRPGCRRTRTALRRLPLLVARHRSSDRLPQALPVESGADLRPSKLLRQDTGRAAGSRRWRGCSPGRVDCAAIRRLPKPHARAWAPPADRVEGGSAWRLAGPYTS